MPTEHAALTEPACVAYNALVEQIRITPGDTVAIQGCGAVGIMATQMARIAGAGAIVVIGTSRDSARLQIAGSVGATQTVNLDAEDPIETVYGLGDELGADIVVDATGVSSALRQSLELVRPLGTIAKIGWGPQPLDFSLDPLVAKAVTLVGSFSHTHQTWERVLTLMATKALDMGPLIGGRYALQDWAEAFTAMEDGRNVKSVITGFGAGQEPQ
ncbi:zinc-binding dehydrogenase [Nocardia sp. NPDC051463]|uniref:zinc-dependent alcohol dehydrogenase n=1 Tax=Nocardia sp. NPDC051463 TaxID=3154845 RepID=UPI00344EBC16